MLVLSRKSGESIMIGDRIEVSVLEVKAGKVCIGIEAPRSVPIFRKEIYLEIQRDLAEEDTAQVVQDALARLKSS